MTASYGARSADAVVTVEQRNVRRPVRVVGRLPRTNFLTAEVWIHPNGNVAYLGTHGGGDRVYTIDITNPAAPTTFSMLVIVSDPPKVPVFWAVAVLRLTVTLEVEAE